MAKEFQIIPSTRGVLYYIEGDGYYFHKQKVRQTKMYFKCHIESCPVRAVTHTSLKYAPTFSRLAHNHAPNPDLPKVLRLRSKILNRCENETTFPRTIYYEEIDKVSPNIGIQLPFSSLCRTMYRRQKDFMDIADYVHANETDEDDLEVDDDEEEESVGSECLIDVTEIDDIESSQEHSPKQSPKLTKKYISQSMKQKKNSSAPAAKMKNRGENPKVNFNQLLSYETLSIGNSDSDNSVSCVVCDERASTIACVPCGHLCLCDQCRLSYRQFVCPVCNESLSPFIKVL